jgi:hypothetical protein
MIGRSRGGQPATHLPADLPRKAAAVQTAGIPEGEYA